MSTRIRKSPSQERSRATVDAMLEATARVLVKEGYDRASTNKIAAVAGVSIGSVYQYFPSKEALVAAVCERHSAELLRMMRNVLARVASSPIEVAARAFVSVAVESHRVNTKLHRVLVEQIPRSRRFEGVEAINREAYALIRDYLDAHRDEIDVTDIESAAFICTTAVDALTHAAIVNRPEMLTESFVDEVTDLVVRYLIR